MARKKNSTWGTERSARAHKAYQDWRARHPGIKTELYMSAKEDAGMWTACIRIFVLADRHPEIDLNSFPQPIGRRNYLELSSTLAKDFPDPAEHGADWAPSMEQCMDYALADFERECANDAVPTTGANWVERYKAKYGLQK